jgi:hypothetical protein
MAAGWIQRGRARREKVRLEAAEMIEVEASDREMARRFRVADVGEPVAPRTSSVVARSCWFGAT